MSAIALLIAYVHQCSIAYVHQCSKKGNDYRQTMLLPMEESTEVTRYSGI